MRVGKHFPGLEEFLNVYPNMKIVPPTNYSLILKGKFDYKALRSGTPQIIDSYTLTIDVPTNFPEEIPKVIETDNKIPRDGKHHVNLDGTLCLGSPLSLLYQLNKNPTLVGFAENCLVPYLYDISHKQMYGTYPSGELAHGEIGVINDYINLFGLSNREQVIHALTLLGMKKRLANKKRCPCGCGKRLGACPYHFKVIEFRKLAARSWFRWHLKNLGSGK